MIGVMPILSYDLGPGETAEVPSLPAYDGPLGILLGQEGGLSGPALGQLITLPLPLIHAEQRRHHWQQALNETGDRSEGGREKARKETGRTETCSESRSQQTRGEKTGD
jgi:hypothetical protein